MVVPDPLPVARGVADERRRLALAAELSAVVVLVMTLLARLHPAPDGPQFLPWERPLSSLPSAAASVARAAFAALPEIERGVAAGVPVAVTTLRDDLVAPFFDAAFSFERIVDRDGAMTAYIGRGDATAPVASLLLVVQPTTEPPGGVQDEEHHRLVDAAGAPVWLHGAVWFLPAGQPPPSSAAGVAAPVALGYLRVRSF